MNNNSIPNELFNQMFKDRAVRIALTKESHFYFFNFYFSHYVTHPTAVFQKEILALSECDTNLFVVAFRGSGKSTMVTTSYPIWAILGKQQKKFVVMLFQTIAQARMHLKNLRYELESNQLLKNDLGPFEEESDEWGSNSLVFPELGARITVASTEQSIRGLRHHQHRPDLIICDDLENLSSVKTLEGRDKVYQWLTGEVIPAGDINTRLIIVGNLLHEDSLIMKMKKDLFDGRIEGIFKEYPLINEYGLILWPGKFPTEESLETLKKKAGNEAAWQREYLLKIIPDADKIIFREWIQTYDELPPTDDEDYRYIGAYTAVDLAVSQADSADYTAIVSIKVYGYGDDRRYYVLPFPVNERMIYPKTRQKIKEISTQLGDGIKAKIFIEKVAFQGAVEQDLKYDHYPAIGVSVNGDKRSRLSLISYLIQQGHVLFPTKGCEILITQLVYFGVEKHDDLCDALVMCLTELMKENHPKPMDLAELNPHLMGEPEDDPFGTENLLYKIF